MKKYLNIIIISFFVFIALPVFAWDGVNITNGHLIEIPEGNLVRSNEDIEVIDYKTGQLKIYQVDEIDDNQINVIDYSSGEYQILDMDAQ